VRTPDAIDNHIPVVFTFVVIEFHISHSDLTLKRLEEVEGNRFAGFCEVRESDGGGDGDCEARGHVSFYTPGAFMHTLRE